DIANMATKEDIANMATKDDIANMATKDDIANMATKDDMASLVTKDEFATEMDKIHQKFAVMETKMDQHFRVLHDGYTLTYEKIGNLEQKFDRMQETVERQDVEIRVIKNKP